VFEVFSRGRLLRGVDFGACYGDGGAWLSTKGVKQGLRGRVAHWEHTLCHSQALDVVHCNASVFAKAGFQIASVIRDLDSVPEC
jgi:hypothetical protein